MNMVPLRYKFFQIGNKTNSAFDWRIIDRIKDQLYDGAFFNSFRVIKLPLVGAIEDGNNTTQADIYP